MSRQRRDRMDEHRGRAGQAVDAIGAVGLGGLAIAALFFVARFITGFSDGCEDRFLACAVELWPVWLVAGLLALGVVAALGRLWVGGRVTLAGGMLVGAVMALVGCWLLAAGDHDGVRTLLLMAVAAGGLTMAVRSGRRLRRPGPDRRSHHAAPVTSGPVRAPRRVGPSRSAVRARSHPHGRPVHHLHGHPIPEPVPARLRAAHGIGEQHHPGL